jgi:gliding motility-associated protein GldM
MPKVVAPTSYVIIGQQYEADVFLAAYSKTSAPEIVVGGSTLPVEDGMGKYRVSPRTPGEQKWGGMIRVKQPDNTYKEYPFESSFIASAPSASVSADKMNVIYIGVDNPISISVPGVPAEKVSFNAKGVTLTPDAKGGKGHFLAKATAVGEATIDVVAAQGDKKIPMGSFKFRLKRIPDPIAKIGGKKEGSIPKAQLAAQSAIIPVMEGFDFDLFSKVKSFKMSRYGKGRDPIEKTSDSNTLTGDMKTIIDQSRPGDKILFEYIKATMPDGTTRDINSISLTVQ